jgi:hypothetical protein
MPLSPSALARISDRHTRYKALLEARANALVARVDAVDNLPTWQAQAAALAAIEHEAEKLAERSWRHQERSSRLVRRMEELLRRGVPEREAQAEVAAAVAMWSRGLKKLH